MSDPIDRDRLLTEVHTDVKWIKREVESHEPRIRSLESDRDKLKALALTGGGGGLVGFVTGIWHYFKH